MERHTIIRLARMDELMRAKKYPNCGRLAQLFEVSQRTVLRDIEAMKDSLGAPILYSKQRNGYYYSHDKFTLPSIRLTEGELVAVFLGEELLKKYKNTPFEAEIEKAFKKIELLMPDFVSLKLDEVSRSFSFDILNTRELNRQDAETFSILSKAIKSRVSVQVVYYSIGRNKTETRVIDPYHLRHTYGTWYLIAYCHTRKAIRTFAVKQIRSIIPLQERFVIPKDFSIDKYLEHSWRIISGQPLTTVVVRLDKEIARWFIDRKLHASQKTLENKDGSLTLTFKVSGTDEIKRWIMSMGKYAKVIEPKALRKEILNEIKKVLK
jgi:predicted DNA-binding transcriptional regulator YafY